MNIIDIQKCANYYKKQFVEQFYIITTYSDSSFILVAEKTNFPHLMGIPQKIYRSNGYAKAHWLYEDILAGKSIKEKIIPKNIAPKSKIYNKVLHFCDSTDIIWNNKCPLIVNYDPTKSSSKLDNVDKLLLDIDSGFMLGCLANKLITVTSDISLSRYCISSWIDEKGNATKNKEKYMPNQDVELVHTVIACNAVSDFVWQREYKNQKDVKEHILRAISRNNANLLINKRNENNYVKVAKDNGIHCSINGVTY